MAARTARHVPPSRSRAPELLTYSCAGTCCSTSRHALIFRRRQTQHSCSEALGLASAPQTSHRTTGCVRRFSGGDTTSAGLRFMPLLTLYKPMQPAECKPPRPRRAPIGSADTSVPESPALASRSFRFPREPCVYRSGSAPAPGLSQPAELSYAPPTHLQRCNSMTKGFRRIIARARRSFSRRRRRSSPRLQTHPESPPEAANESPAVRTVAYAPPEYRAPARSDGWNDTR